MHGSQLVLALVALAGAAMPTAGSSPANHTVRLSADLVGMAEVPRGDRDGSGQISLVVKPEKRRVCFEFELSQVESPTAGQIHQGGPGASGPARLTLFERAAGIRGHSGDPCAKKQKRKLLRQIAERPQRFYVNLRNDDFPHGAVRGQLGPAIGGFERDDFREFDSWSAVNGSLTVTSELAYEGSRSAKAANNAVGNQFQRVWYDVDWREGSDVWYGMALYIPRLSDWCWWSPIRWDNFQSYGSVGDVGGLRVEDSALYLDQGNYSAQSALIGPVPIPEARWVWLEIHQHLSGTPGTALSELYLDGAMVGSSTAANTAGRPINQIRFGNVAMDTSCSQPSSIYFDRVSMSGAERGPLPGLPHGKRQGTGA